MELFNDLLERLAADESHRIVGPPVGIRPQAIDWHNARMFESAGDLRFPDEPLAAHRIVGDVRLDLLERHFAGQFAILCDEDLAESPAGMWPENAKPLARRILEWIDR